MRRALKHAQLGGENFAVVLFLSLAGLDLSFWLLAKGTLSSALKSAALM
jgi:hypothetical protein